MPLNDGSETQELFNSNISDIAMLQAKLSLAKGQSTDLGNQLRDSFALIRESRSMLEIAMVKDPQLQTQILELITRIDEFYPQHDIQRY